jgi:hypothetical protein
MKHNFKLKSITVLLMSAVFLPACNKALDSNPTATTPQIQYLENESRLDIYHTVELTTDLSALSDKQKHMLSLLIDASKIMDDLFWKQSFGEDKNSFLAKITDPKVRNFAETNYGPFDRLEGDKVFLSTFSEKPQGAQFYPDDMTKEEFDLADISDKKGLYSIIKRNAQHQLVSVPYSEIYNEELNRAANILKKAATYAEDKSFANYLNIRAEAFITDNYQPSDFAWMDMKTNPIELVIGPIETYEDQLFGYRAAFESYVLIKDLAWSEKLTRFAAYLPELQEGLPVQEVYKAQMPGTDADLNAYDVIYYAGHSNAGSKTIAINLPNDEEVQLQKGTRRLQLKNAMQAKFDNILIPIAEQLIVTDQRKHITFNAFFANTMFHEISHGLGIKQVLGSEQTVRQALKEHASALEEGKADVLGLYMIRQLLEKGAITEGVLEDYYVTFMAGIFRSVRFGASSAHGKANMIRFNFFAEQDAFTRDENGMYKVDISKMSSAIDALSEVILTLQGNGDYKGVEKLVAEKGVISEVLSSDLNRLTNAKIPVDITFNQGKKILGL